MPSKSVLVPLAAILGGIAAGVGSFFPWLRSSAGRIGIAGGAVPEEVLGYDLSIGIVALAAAAVAVVAALIWLAIVRGLPVIAVVLLLTGVLIAGAAAYTWVTAEERFVDFAAAEAANQETTAAELRDLLPRFFAANDVSVEPDLGLYLTLGGGTLVFLCGIAAIVTSRRRILAPSGERAPASKWS